MRTFLMTAGIAALFLAGCSERTTTAAKPSDADIESAVKAQLATDPVLQPYHLEVDSNVDKNAIVLSGKVTSEVERTQAVALAEAARPGVTITDKIDVKPREVTRTEYTEDMAREARERAKSAGDKIGSTLDDAWLHTKITTKLIADKDTPASKINVDVNNKVVTLRGHVATETAKAEAERIARETDGVARVNNQLKIAAE
jgi:osmotically-inducible protein OsmY